MKQYVKSFNELSAFELYKIYKARVAVFVVEQACPYQEVDDADREAIHLWLEDDNEDLVAYARVLPKNDHRDHVMIGRLLTLERKKGYGTKILQLAIETAQKKFAAKDIEADAQSYVQKLYEKQGFQAVSQEFLLDDIPHVKMRLTL